MAGKDVIHYTRSPTVRLGGKEAGRPEAKNIVKDQKLKILQVVGRCFPYLVRGPGASSDD